MGSNFSLSVSSKGHRCKHGKLKKVIRKKGKRYYKTKSGLVRLKGKQKPPKLKT